MEKLKCVGLDVFVVSKTFPQVPKSSDSFTLKLISQRGLNVSEETPPDQLLVDWYCCRYISNESPNAESVTKLLYEIGKVAEWEKVQKLYQGPNGDDRFSKAYEG